MTLLLAGLALLASLIALVWLWRSAEDRLFEASRRSWPSEED